MSADHARGFSPKALRRELYEFACMFDLGAVANFGEEAPILYTTSLAIRTILEVVEGEPSSPLAMLTDLSEAFARGALADLAGGPGSVESMLDAARDEKLKKLRRVVKKLRREDAREAAR